MDELALLADVHNPDVICIVERTQLWRVHWAGALITYNISYYDIVPLAVG